MAMDRETERARASGPAGGPGDPLDPEAAVDEFVALAEWLRDRRAGPADAEDGR